MLRVVKGTLGVHERGGRRVRRMGLMVRAGIGRSRWLVTLGLSMTQNVLVNVLGMGRCRGTSTFYTP